MTTIQEFYDIKYTKEIGRGASGKVYYATRKYDGLNTAVKVISRTSLNHDNLKAILNEIRTLKDLDHPNIVKLYDMFEDKRFFYLAMEYIQGGELFDRITKKTYYNEHDARELCKIILSAIKYLHERNIVHRDLKPENLLLNKDDDDTDVKLVDFGFCDTVGNGRMLSGIMGTPMYMAPEIWSEGPYEKPVDMWAFGVITYILLGGYPPFSEEKREKLIQHIQSGVFVFHEQYWNGVSDEAKDFITQCLNINPMKRMTVEQAFHHPWLFKSGLDQIHLENTLENLRDFNAKRRLKSAFSAVIAINRMNKLLSVTNTLTSSLSTTSSSSQTKDDVNNNNTVITTEKGGVDVIDTKRQESEQNAEILSSFVKQYSVHNHSNTNNNNSHNNTNGPSTAIKATNVSFQPSTLAVTVEDIEVDMNTTDYDDDDNTSSNKNDYSSNNKSGRHNLRQSPSERRIPVQSIVNKPSPGASSSSSSSDEQNSKDNSSKMNVSNHNGSQKKANNDESEEDDDEEENNNSNNNNDFAVVNPCVIS